MKFIQKDPPRVFQVGKAGNEIRDCGEVYLEPNEQVTFLTPSGTEYDLAKKTWGYYATPSLNGRVKMKGHSAALVRNAKNQDYIMFVEKGKETDFEQYIQNEEERIVLWLDGRDERKVQHLLLEATSTSCVCSSPSLVLQYKYQKPPKAEVQFKFSQTEKYSRELYCCSNCGHFRSIHSMDDVSLYEGQYVDSNYGKTGILPVFEKIINLPPEKSDNKGRVKRVVSFCEDHFGNGKKLSILDIGSGLGVFLYEIKKSTTWDCTALDPDPRSCEHAQVTIGVSAIHGDIMKTNIKKTFDVVALNRVLEHVKDPVALLSRAHMLLNSNGVFYVEVPHGTLAFKDSEGANREEFTIDHLHVFSITSLSLCAEKAGFSILRLGTHREPSGKYTLYAFLQKM